MTPTVNRLVGGLALVALAVPAYALTTDSSANPYQVVVERNVFGLKPAPRPEDLVPPPAPTPPIQIKLQGITEGILGGKRQVLMKIMEPPSKPGEQPKERAVIMDEGERRGDIEVLAIDSQARTVKLNNNGTVTNLMLTDFITRVTAPVTGPAPGAPGVMPVPAPGMPRPVPQPQAGMVPPPGAQPQLGVGISPVQPSQPHAGITMPSRPVRTATAGLPGAGVPATAQRPLSMEEQTAIMEVERLRTRDAVSRGEMPPLPPTPWTPQ